MNVENLMKKNLVLKLRVAKITVAILCTLLLSISVGAQAFKYLQGESVFYKILGTKPNKQNIPSGYVAQYADSGGLKYEGKNGTVVTVMDSANATDFVLNAHGTISVNSTTYALDSSALANANVGPSTGTDKAITSITNGSDGQELTLHFTGIVTVTTAAAKLAGNVSFVAANHDSLTLKYSGSEWYEIGRQQQVGILGLPVSGTTGAFSSTLASTGNFAVNTNKFNVTASNGNTNVGGTLNSVGNFSVATNKITGDATTGIFYAGHIESAVASITPSASIDVATDVSGPGNVLTLTPGEDETITDSAVPAVGCWEYVVITTSGSTSRTLTFSTGFKTTGTLATGTVSGKVFVIVFVSDGTTFYEVSRTTAM